MIRVMYNEPECKSGEPVLSAVSLISYDRDDSSLWWLETHDTTIRQICVTETKARAILKEAMVNGYVDLTAYRSEIFLGG